MFPRRQRINPLCFRFQLCLFFGMVVFLVSCFWSDQVIAQRPAVKLKQVPSAQFVSANPQGLTAKTGVHAGEERPNVIIILVDDMGYSDIGCYGGEIETPNLDALANDGLRFTQFYNQGRCCPTRASLLTGLQPHQVGIGHMTEPPDRALGITGPYQGFLNDRCTTIPSVLKSAGYQTMMTGKWHLGFSDRNAWPMQRGFDRFYGCITGAVNYFKPGGNRSISEGNETVATDNNFYATDAFTDRACEYITEAVDDDKPFFLYLAYNAPHWPLNAKWQDYQKYRGKYKSGWHQLMKDRNARQEAMGLFPAGTQAAPFPGPKWESLKEPQRDRLDAIMAAYAGCVDSIDQNIGKLVKHLKSVDQFDNTVIFFLSDNGACQEGGPFGVGDEAMIKNPPLETVDGVRIGLHWAGACNTPFRKYKHFVHEGGACTPMIAHWPRGIAATDRGKFVRQTAYLQDFMATVIELSGATYPPDNDVLPCLGRSMVPLLKGDRKPIHTEPLFFEHEGNAAVRHGDWKLVREYKKPWELFNIARDRTELTNLADAEVKRRDQMIAAWKSWATKTGVAFPERFNMYQFLNKQKKKEKQKQKKGPKKEQPKKAKQNAGLTRPNIVVFLSDDHTFSDSSLYGSKDMQTPNMDRIAAAGMTFDRAYVASPSCAPSRAAMLTGLYPANNGAEPNHSRPKKSIKKLPAYLQELGYEVVSFGKVGHYAQTPEYGFDLAKHFGYHDDVAIDEAVKWLKSRQSDKPLCLFVGTNWPHVPWPEKSSYDPSLLLVPNHHVDTPETRKARAAYYEAVKTMDNEMGKVYDAAREVFDDQFFFLHTSDHGAQWPFAKWNLYEEGIRTPMIAAWPGKIKTGVRSDAMVSWIDILPTLVDVADGPKPQGLDGKSMLPLMQGKQQNHRQTIFATHSGDGSRNVFPMRSVRKGKWKYIRSLYPQFQFESHVTKVKKSNHYWSSWERKAKQDVRARKVVDAYRFRPAEELYNLELDPGEQNNLAANPGSSMTLDDLRSELDQWMESTEDSKQYYGNPDLRRGYTREGKLRDKQPNIVTVFIDDMGWADLSCFGGETQTPNIDRLAKVGIKFHQFYVNSPICSSSRCALTTGMYPQRLKITSFLARRELNQKRGMENWLDVNVDNLPRMMKRAGYATGHFGKWHLGGQRDVGEAPLITEYGFDQSLTNFEGLGPRVLPLKDRYDGKPPVKHALGSDQLGRGKIEWLDRSIITARFVKDAVQFIDQSQAEGKPFYINLWPDDVHSPFFPPEGRRGDNQKKTLYQAVLKTMDEQLNELFQRIENDPKLKDNTIILIASDNGPEPGAGSAGQLRGVKGELWEGGIRSPIIVWGPGYIEPKAAGTINKTTVLSSIDLVASLIPFSNLAPSDKYRGDGKNLLSVLLGYSSYERQDSIFWRRPPGHKKFRPGFNPDLAVRSRNWKLVCHIDGSHVELYNLDLDPGETRNVAARKPKIRQRLLEEVLAWNESMPADASATDNEVWSRPKDKSDQQKRNQNGKGKKNGDGAKAKPPSGNDNQNASNDQWAASRPPNMVILLADDLGWNAVGYHNNTIKTPNIDSIADRGVRLDRFYVAPMCSPTRAGLLTGRYPIRFGCARAVIPPQRDFGLPLEETTLAENLESLGYTRRGVFGKWHLGHRRAKWHPLNQGFTHFVGHYNGAIDYFELTRSDTRDWHHNYQPSDDQGYATDLIADAACNFIQQSVEMEEPYLCYVPFNAPHSPFQVPQDALDAVTELSPREGENAQQFARRKTYVAMIQRMDIAIGKILNTIQRTDRKGSAANTIVWFLSDNGGVNNISQNNAPLRGSKLTVYEGGIRVPACLSWPARIKPGTQCDDPIGYIDMHPTLLAATGKKVEHGQGKPLDGINVGPAILGDPETKNQIAQRSWYSYHGQKSSREEHLAVTVGGWKLKVNGPRLESIDQLNKEAQQVELFQIAEDPKETVDLKSKYPERVKALASKLVAYRALQPKNSVTHFRVGQKDFIPPPRWQLDPREPNRLVGKSQRD